MAGVMVRARGYVALVAAVLAYGARLALEAAGFQATALGARVAPILVTGLTVLAIALVAYAAYLLVLATLRRFTKEPRRRRAQQGILRAVFGALAFLGVVGVLTEQWLGVFFSLGVVGFAVTFAIQQPLFSFIGWVYILAKEPYEAGDRVAIGDARGDVVSVDMLVTRIWETDGELVSTNQPSGRIITVPNSMVLSSQVTNFHGEGVDYVWNELTVQVSYESDLEFARETMRKIADEYLGDEMARKIAKYRDRLSETPVELEVQDRPTVNVVQRESWVELKLRYLVHPRRGTRVRNALLERILTAFNDEPDKVSIPVGRSR